MLNERELQIAFKAAPDEWNCKKSHLEIIEWCITAYLSTVTPTEVGGLVERLNIKAGVMEMGERIAWGSDTAIIREAATALAAKDAELAAVHQRYVDANEARIDAEAQLAEALHLLGRYRTETPLGSQPHMIAAKVDDFARRAREAQGGA